MQTGSAIRLNMRELKSAKKTVYAVYAVGRFPSSVLEVVLQYVGRKMAGTAIKEDLVMVFFKLVAQAPRTASDC